MFKSMMRNMNRTSRVIARKCWLVLEFHLMVDRVISIRFSMSGSRMVEIMPVVVCPWYEESCAALIAHNSVILLILSNH